MKRLILCLSVAIAICGLPLENFSQETIKPATTDAARSKLNLHTPQAKITDVLAEIKDYFSKEGQSFNAILSSEAMEVVVPPLEMRNVSATDALMLIAAATDLRVQPISSLEGRPIGFKFEKREAANAFALPVPTTTPITQESIPPGASTQNTQPKRTVTFPAALPSQNESPMRTEVYPVTSIGGKETLIPIVEHLQEMLSSDYSRSVRDEIKISIHEKTGVLVFRGPESAHRLLESYLQAYSQNTRYKERAPQEKLDRELTALKAKMEALAAENDRMKAAAREAEERARKLEKQLKDSPQ